MAFNLGSITAFLRLDSTNYMSGLARAQTATSTAVSSMRVGYAAVNAQLDLQARRIRENRTATIASGQSFKDLGRIVSGILISQVFYKGVQAIQSATAAVAGFSVEMEVANASLTRLLKSPENARGFINSMKEFAAVTEYSAIEALEFSRRLAAMGFEAEKTRDLMSIITDEVALLGGGAQKLDRIVYALGQIKNEAKLSAPNVRQLTEATVPAVKYLQKAFKLTAEEAMNIGEQNIPGVQAVKAILMGMQADSKGAAAVIAETLRGMVSTIKDNISYVLEAALAPVYGTIKDGVKIVKDALQDVYKIITFEGGIGGLVNKIFSPEMATAIRAIVVTLKYLGVAFYYLYKAISPLVSGGLKYLVLMLGLIGPTVATAISGFAALAFWLVENVPYAKELGSALMALLIVSRVAAAFMFFYKVVRIGAIVLWFTHAIEALTLAFGVLRIMVTSTALYAGIVNFGRAMLFAAAGMMSGAFALSVMLPRFLLLLAAASAVAAGVVALGYAVGWLGKQAVGLTDDLMGIPEEAVLPVIVDPNARSEMDRFDKKLLDLGLRAKTVEEAFAKPKPFPFPIKDPKMQDAMKNILGNLDVFKDKSAETADGAADEMAKAAKKMKTDFTASFDEIFNVPDKLDTSDMMKEIDTNAFAEELKALQDELSKPLPIPKIDWGTPPWWVTALLTGGLVALWAGLKGLWGKYVQPAIDQFKRANPDKYPPSEADATEDAERARNRATEASERANTADEAAKEADKAAKEAPKGETGDAARQAAEDARNRANQLRDEAIEADRKALEAEKRLEEAKARSKAETAKEAKKAADEAAKEAAKAEKGKKKSKGEGTNVPEYEDPGIDRIADVKEKIRQQTEAKEAEAKAAGTEVAKTEKPASPTPKTAEPKPKVDKRKERREKRNARDLSRIENEAAQDISNQPKPSVESTTTTIAQEKTTAKETTLQQIEKNTRKTADAVDKTEPPATEKSPMSAAEQLKQEQQKERDAEYAKKLEREAKQAAIDAEKEATRKKAEEYDKSKKAAPVEPITDAAKREAEFNKARAEELQQLKDAATKANNEAKEAERAKSPDATEKRKKADKAFEAADNQEKLNANADRQRKQKVDYIAKEEAKAQEARAQEERDYQQKIKDNEKRIKKEYPGDPRSVAEILFDEKLKEAGDMLSGSSKSTADVAKEKTTAKESTLKEVEKNTRKTAEKVTEKQTPTDNAPYDPLKTGDKTIDKINAERTAKGQPPLKTTAQIKAERDFKSKQDIDKINDSAKSYDAKVDELVKEGYNRESINTSEIATEKNTAKEKTQLEVEKNTRKSSANGKKSSEETTELRKQVAKQFKDREAAAKQKAADDKAAKEQAAKEAKEAKQAAKEAAKEAKENAKNLSKLTEIDKELKKVKGLDDQELGVLKDILTELREDKPGTGDKPDTPTAPVVGSGEDKKGTPGTPSKSDKDTKPPSKGKKTKKTVDEDQWIKDAFEDAKKATDNKFTLEMSVVDKVTNVITGIISSLAGIPKQVVVAIEAIATSVIPAVDATNTALDTIPDTVQSVVTVEFPESETIQERFKRVVTDPVATESVSLFDSIKDVFNEVVSWIDIDWTDLVLPVLTGSIILIGGVLAGAAAPAGVVGLAIAGLIATFTALWTDVQPSEAAGGDLEKAVDNRLLKPTSKKVGTWSTELLKSWKKSWDDVIDISNRGLGNIGTAEVTVNPIPIGNVTEEYQKRMSNLTNGAGAPTSFNTTPQSSAIKDYKLFKFTTIPALASGGIVTKDTFIRAGEGNKKEAIIPLESSGIIQSFAKNIALELKNNSTSQPGNANYIMIGTLIGDERSITLLERKLNAVRIKEDYRKGS